MTSAAGMSYGADGTAEAGEVCSEVAVGAGHRVHGRVLLEIRASYSEEGSLEACSMPCVRRAGSSVPVPSAAKVLGRAA